MFNRYFVIMFITLIMLSTNVFADSSVDLTTSTPVENDMDFSYSGAAYDSYYEDHWRITSINGYMQFSFYGKEDFSYHALGSTSSGVSYCYIDIYINGSLYTSDKFIEKNWTWYQIPSSEFGSGTNTVKIVLTGDTHLWLDQARSTISSSGGSTISGGSSGGSSGDSSDDSSGGCFISVLQF